MRCIDVAVLLVCACMLSGCGDPGSAQTGASLEVDDTFDKAAETKAVHAALRESIEALHGLDAEAVLAATHPAVFAVKGRDTVETELKRTIAAFEKLQLKLTRLAFNNMPEFIQTEKHVFASVPLQTTMTSMGKKETTDTTRQFAVRDLDSSEWKTLLVVRPSQLGEIFEDFPAATNPAAAR